MTRDKLLYILSSGIIELFLLLVFSLIGLSRESSMYIVILKVAVALFVGSSIWHFYYRVKADSYLIVTIIRWILMAVVVVSSQLEMVVESEPEIPGLYWFFASAVCIIVTLLWVLKKEKQLWPNTLEIWQKIKKIDLENKIFYISVPNYMMNKDGMMNYKKGISVAIPAFLVIRLFEFYGLSFDFFISRLGGVILSGFLGMAIAKFLSWTINMKNTENELQSVFITEYGDSKVLARLRKKKV